MIEEPHTVFNKRIKIPDSFPVIFINFGAPFIWEMENGTVVELPRRVLVNVQTKPLNIRATGWCQAIGLTLSPWATRFFVDDHVDLAAQPVTPLGGVWHDLVTGGLPDENQIIATLRQFLCDTQHRNRFDITPFRTVLDNLYAANGRGHIHELAAESHLSTSQLERHSKYFTGLSPKTMSRLIRFDAVCAGLTEQPGYRMTDLAYQFGFVDQAHFIHEFKTFAACTPRQAAVYMRQIAADAEFLQFS